MLKPTKNTSRHLALIVLLLIAFQALSNTQIFAGSTASILIKNHLKKKIELETTQKRLRCRGELICGLSQIPLFYQRRGFFPAWCTDKGMLPQAESLITEIKGAHDEGLEPNDYHLTNILSLIEKIKNQQPPYSRKSEVTPLEKIAALTHHHTAISQSVSSVCKGAS